MNPAAVSRGLIPLQDGRTDVEQILEILASWHDEQHAGPFRRCDEQPCHAAQAGADLMGEEQRR